MLKGGSSSAVERQLPKLDVTGSIPVSRSINLQRINNVAIFSSGSSQPICAGVPKFVPTESLHCGEHRILLWMDISAGYCYRAVAGDPR